MKAPVKYYTPDAESVQWEALRVLCDSVRLGNEGYYEDNIGEW